jgi:hypothetical protein
MNIGRICGLHFFGPVHSSPVTAACIYTSIIELEFLKRREIYRLPEKLWTWGILDSIVIVYWLGDPGFQSRHWQYNYLFSETSRLSFRLTQPPTQCITGPFPQ